MEANSIAAILAMILVGLIGLSLLFWLSRLIWEIVTSGPDAGECRIVR